MNFLLGRFNEKLTASLRNYGLRSTLIKIAKYILRTEKFKNRWYAKSLGADSRKEIFTKIYKHNYWGSSESVSGGGSTVELTVNLRQKLPTLFEDFGIDSVYDAPCGDFNWMRLLMKEVNISYIGADIVPELIVRNNDKYKSENIQFLLADITTSVFPKADLWICRDCLFHLSYKDIISTLENYAGSDISYILTSTHINNIEFHNNDIMTGGFRHIDLFKIPFCFPPEPLYRIVDWIRPHSQREMCLWTRSQIVEVLPKMRQLAGL